MYLSDEVRISARSDSPTDFSYEDALVEIVATAWPSSITLSDNTALEGIINDIPFFSVGLLAFGVLTFFFVLRRLKMYTVYLHVSVILAFLGAVLDFSQILVRGETNVTENQDIIAVWPLIVMRELAFSLSIGMRFFFFWCFIGEPPRGEALVPSSGEPGLHSGRWEKSGWLGIAGKWLTVLGVFGVPVLQAVWRLVADRHNFGPVYYADNILEISLSGLFIIKLFMNTLHTSLTPRFSVLVQYLPIIVTLLINSGIAIGNMITFEFSESTLGRFLQAVELYILILYVLITEFHKRIVRQSIASWTSRPEPSQFEAISMPAPFEQGFRISKFPTIVNDGEQLPTPIGNSMRSLSSVHRSRVSSNSRFSTWIHRGLLSRPPGPDDVDQEQLWDQEQAERGVSPFSEKAASESIIESVEAPEMQEPGLTVEYPSRQRITLSQAMMPSGGSRTPSPVVMPTISRRSTPIENRDAQTARAEPSDRFTESERENHATSASLSTMALSDFVHAKDSERAIPTDSVVPASFTGMSVFQYYTGSDEGAARSLRDIRIVPDSPIYGLAGALSKTSEEWPTTHTAPDVAASARSSGIAQILREQEELDKSIANLRLLVSRDSTDLNSDTLSEEGVSDRRIMSQSLASHASISGRSDLSLSHFPAPPTFTTNSIVKPRKVSARASRPDILRFGSLPSSGKRSTFGLGGDLDNVEEDDDTDTELEPPRMPAALAEQSFPMAARASSDSTQGVPFRNVRFGSDGTQYDVTSFIGDSLPVAVATPPSPGVSDKAWTTDDEEPEDAKIVTVARKHSSSRPKYVQKSALLTVTSGLPTFPQPAVTSPASTMNVSPTSLRSGRTGLPPRPRLGI